MDGRRKNKFPYILSEFQFCFVLLFKYVFFQGKKYFLILQNCVYVINWT